MKKILGFLFCIGFLLMAVTVDIQAQVTVKQTITEVVYFDGAVSDNTIDVRQAVDPADKYHFKQAFREAAIKADATLFYSYRLIPLCPVHYLGKQRYRQGYTYLYKYSSNYNQPPNYQLTDVKESAIFSYSLYRHPCGA
ncbi:hypothetical protein [Dysgonomonas sp. ZJ709]|uniref:hypothetical protein n=1 Tax=Dysgonomonas sp. ZJ709 TaxID=2709797 RepID=UPI0013EBD462|nr:hypothetical protein [Dysgonomonas sp. ZJ709]